MESKNPIHFFSLIRLIVMGVINKGNLLLFLIDLIHQDVMPDMKATVAFQLVPERFAYLWILGKFQQFLCYLLKPHRILLGHLIKFGLDVRVRDYREGHWARDWIKSSIDL